MRKILLYILGSLIVIVISIFFIITTKTFTVNFITGGGTIYPSQTIKPGQKVVQPADPLLEGFVFTGWYLNDTDEKFDFNTEIYEDVSITAKYERVS